MEALETAPPPAADDNAQVKQQSPVDSIQFLEAAALLSLWSILVYNEGAIRFNDTAPSVDLFSSGRPSKIVLFSAALSEVIFGLLGFLVGISALLLKWYSTPVTKIVMVIQTVLGYYVFAIYIFVIPIFDAVDLETPMVDGLSLSQNRAVIIMGLLTSFNFCLALQGGQFIFLARLIVAGSGKDFLMQRKGSQMRAVFWNWNLLMSGVWTFTTGLIVSIAADNGGELETPFVSPPNVSVLPALTAVTGGVMFLWGGVGILLAIRNRKVGSAYYVGTATVFVYMLLIFGIVQFGKFTTGDAVTTSGAVAMHTGLVFMVVFLGAYFLRLSSLEHKES